MFGTIVWIEGKLNHERRMMMYDVTDDVVDARYQAYSETFCHLEK